MDTLDITPVQALQLTCNYVTTWKQLTIKDIALDEISGGYCNRLYRIKNISTIKTEPEQLLIRLYGGKAFGDNEIKILTEPEEVLLFHELSTRDLGPKLFGVFKGGMLTEFISNHTLTNEDLANSIIRKEIARNVAKYHRLDIPVNKTRLDILGKSEQFLRKFEAETKSKMQTPEAQDVLGLETWTLMMTFDFQSEIDWFRNQELRIKSRDVFCIVDLNRLNCLIRKEPNQHGERVMLIDYDLSQVAPRGVDIGGHFFNHVMDMKSEYLNSKLDYPSEEVRREFVEEYLKAFWKETGFKDFEFDDIIDSVDHVVMEAELYGMMIYFMIMLMNFTQMIKLIETRDKLMRFPLKLMSWMTKRKEHFIAKYGE